MLKRTATADPGVAACPAPGYTARFVDNGTTLTDNLTHLEWEKKTTTVGSGVNLADPHDMDNTYTWTVSGSPIRQMGPPSRAFSRRSMAARRA